jgi:glycosyltransferase involved in cell wall biosynthesis
LTIVGRNPVEMLKRRAINENTVTLTGTVEDVRPFIEKAAVYVVPLRIGGGSRLKILEALSMKKPVVSTSIGAEGLFVEPGKNLLIADDADDTVAAITRLFKGSELCEALGNAGRRLVENRYQWKVLAEKLEDTWHRAMKEGGSNN